MAITVTRLTPCFAARIGGADITRPLDDGTWSAIRAAFDEHSVLVFGGPGLDDEQQIAFSRRFGSLEVTRSMNPAGGHALRAPVEPRHQDRRGDFRRD